MIAVACDHQHAGYDMVTEHLPMVFPPFFDVHDKDLLEPKAELNEVVPLHGAFYLATRPIGPQTFHVHPVFVIVHDPLRFLLA